MNVRIRDLVLGAALILAIACGRPSEQTAGVTGGSSTMTADEHAVVVAKAIRAKPAAADSILAAQGLTRAGLDSLLYDIAADPARTQAYLAAVGT